MSAHSENESFASIYAFEFKFNSFEDFNIF